MAFDELSQFFGQMPPALLLNLCLIVAAPLLLLLYFAVIKPMRQNRRRTPPATPRQPATDNPSDPDPYSLMVELPRPQVAPAAPVIPARRPGEYAVRLPDGQTARAVEVLAVLRDTADDRLLVYLDQVGYRTFIETPEVKAKFTALMKELAETIAKPDTPRPVSPANTVAAAEPEPIMSVSDDVGRAEPGDDLDMPDLDTLSTLPVSPPVPPLLRPAPPVPPKPRPAASRGLPGALPDYREAAEADPKVTRRGIFRPPKVEFAPVPELNLAAAIETYLQHKRQITGAYADRNIHVHSAPGGGVVIQVDDAYYEAVGDIAETDVREFVAATIQEWQEHQ